MISRFVSGPVVAFAVIATAGARMHRAVPVAQPAFRVLEWNVSDSAWIKNDTAARAVLRHANPDILVLAQVAPGIDGHGLHRMVDGLRGPADTTWFFSARPGGGAENEVIATRSPVTNLPEFARVSLPDTGSVAVGVAIPADSMAAARRAGAVDTVRVNGAIARVDGRSVMIIDVHLTCCGTPDTWREYRRRFAAVVIRERIRAAIARATPQALIIAGDMNLVAGGAALDTLLGTVARGPLGPIRRADALQSDGWTDWTWDGRGTAFNGGRLDNVLYSAGTLSVGMARIWDTEYLPADTLAAHQLNVGTSKQIGRHRPVVVDFSFIR